MTMYHEKFAFFPDDANNAVSDWFEVYLISDTAEEITLSRNVKDNPVSVSKSDYTIRGPFGAEQIKHRIEDPDYIYKGLIYQFIKK